MDATLPILAHRTEIIDHVRRHQVVVIAGETGSGKTTVVPRFLLEDGLCRAGMIGVTEPRRIAAVSVAIYVASELGSDVGDLVGYQIRHENRSDPAVTKIKYMTEGVLLREMLADPLLRKYDVVILDEVHERNVHQDLLMALMKELLPRRPELRVVVMSATIDEDRFAAYFSAPVIRIKGRMFPVAIEHALEDADDHVPAAVEKIADLLGRTEGDILVFMPDYESIRQTMELLGESPVVKALGVDVLLRELLADPLLRKYDVVILDEVHERNVHQDLLMALMKELLPRRPELRVVVMSATIDEDRFAAYFSAPVIRIKGRMFPVAIEHSFDDADDHVVAAVEKIADLLGRTEGDILVFMPDYESIRQTMELLEESPEVKARGVDVMPLYGSQSPEEQLKVFSRERRSVIISTNVAETSVTLDGVTAVVDTGLIKEMRYFPSTSMSALKVVRHSQAGCAQRAGRAGRTAPGICARLYTEADHDRRKPFTVPEIMRSSLDQVFLQMRAMGIPERTIHSFDFLDPPQHALWTDARETLELLGALDGRGELTNDGDLMAEIPLPPFVTRMIITARRHGCVAAVTTVAASFSTRPIFIRPPGQEEEADAMHRPFRDPRSDFQTFLNALKRWRQAPDRKAFAERSFLHGRALEEIDATEKQILAILAEHGIEASARSSPDDIGRAIASGLVANLLESDGGRAYKGRKHGDIFIFPGSSVYARQTPKHVVAAEIVETTRKYARGVQEVPSRWLEEILGRPTHKHRQRKPERFRHRGRRR